MKLEHQKMIKPTIEGISEIEYSKRDNLYSSHILEQYKIYTDRLNRDLDRAQTTNRFFFTINIAILSGLLLSARKDAGMAITATSALSVPAIFFCVLWWRVLLSARQMATAQHETVEEIENYLPMRPYTTEWLEKLEGGKKYIRIGTMRIAIPWIFILIYILFAGYLLLM